MQGVRMLNLMKCCNRPCFGSLTTLRFPKKTVQNHFPIFLSGFPHGKMRHPAVSSVIYRNLCAKDSQNTDETEKKLTLSERLVASCPVDLQPYLKLMRIDKPTGTWLLLWPCYWSLGMATAPGTFPDPTLLLIFASGAFLMRGAGCTINDLWDKNIDAKVARTLHRPLAAGDLSVLDAWMFLGGQLSLALLILLQLNWYSIVLGSTSLFLVTIYPLMKRVTHYPQIVLGLTFNWGALLGWSAVHGSCFWPAVLPCYTGCIFWTMIYDTIYAHQDKVDDVLVKVKSTALKFGENTKPWLSLFAFCSTSCFIFSGLVSGQTWPFYLSVGTSSAILASQIMSLNINDPSDCYKKFKSNQTIGWIIFLGIVMGTYLKSDPEKQNAEKADSIAISNYLPSRRLHL